MSASQFIDFVCNFFCGGAWPAESITHPSEVAKPPEELRAVGRKGIFTKKREWYRIIRMKFIWKTGNLYWCSGKVKLIRKKGMMAAACRIWASREKRHGQAWRSSWEQGHCVGENSLIQMMHCCMAFGRIWNEFASTWCFLISKSVKTLHAEACCIWQY